MEFTDVEATISVLPEKTVNVIPEFINKPKGLDLNNDMLTVEPSKILLAGPKEVLDKTDSVSLSQSILQHFQTSVMSTIRRE